MLMITSFTNPRVAQAFVDYMATQGVILTIQQHTQTDVWLADEHAVGDAGQLRDFPWDYRAGVDECFERVGAVSVGDADGAYLDGHRARLDVESGRFQVDDDVIGQRGSHGVQSAWVPVCVSCPFRHGCLLSAGRAGVVARAVACFEDVPDDVYQLAKAQFSEAELVDLTMAVTTINSWNRLAVSFRQIPSD